MLQASYLVALVLALSAHADIFPEICTSASDAISGASNTYYPGSLQFTSGILHDAVSSTQTSLCVVEPATTEDVAKILNILGSTRTPFAVKGGGHATNPGWSSTPGVHISLAQFTDIHYDASSELAVIGAGNLWTDVYEALEVHGRTVVGGRISGPGVAGFSLGGGYSWLTNQYGLTVDNIEAYELVKPTGEVVNVTKSSDPELFFALKGGGNNFGIVTQFTMRTNPQGEVWGGYVLLTGDHFEEVDAATVKFSSQVTDPKAAIIASYTSLSGQALASIIMFYDGPEQPEGIFDDFLAIPGRLASDVKSRSYLSFIQSTPSVPQGKRGYYQTAPVMRNSEALVAAVRNESEFWGSKLLLSDLNVFIAYAVEPFLADALSHNEAVGPTAYPHTRDVMYLPLNIYYSWSLSSADETMHNAIEASAKQILAAATADGQDVSGAPLYPNYAIFDTPLENIYGAKLERLREVKARVDPENVMGLAGGFKI